MCGIAGIVGMEATGDSGPVMQKMLSAMAHRGPDNESMFLETGVALGHRRLSILDLSEAGHQPMADPTGRYQIILNGEVYNYLDIRKQLKRTAFSTGTDTETLLAAYIERGPACLELFNGMFTLAIWDREEKTLFLARDRMGIKPVYYSLQEGVLIFSSEVRSLLASDLVSRKLNHGALTEYLTYQTVLAPNTLVENIKAMEPGQFGLFQNGAFKLTTWWDPVSRTAEPSKRPSDYNSIKKQVKTLFRDAVERRLLADVPLGAFLSGGIDSSAIVAMMAQVTDQPVDTFSVVFDEKQYDESSYSELIAKKYNTRHHPILLKPDDFLAALPEALSSMDHPSGDGPNSYVVSKVTREQGITVALSGLGGDEVFAGYPVFSQLPALQQKGLIWNVPRLFRLPVAGFTGLFPGGRRGEKIGQVLRARGRDIAQIYPTFRTIYSAQLSKALMESESSPNRIQELLKQQPEGFASLPNLSQISVAEFSTYMQNVLLRDTDQMSMAHALEVRVPFLDHELVEYVLGVPDTHKTPSIPKRLLVESLGELLPDEIVHRKKMGFVFPWARWLRKDLAVYAGERMNRMSKRGLFKPLQLKNIWKDFQQNKTYLVWVHIWLLVVLDEWIENNRIEI